jgi:hypothetical protein
MKKLIYILILMLVCIGASHAQKKYAVLIAGDYGHNLNAIPSGDRWNNGDLMGGTYFDEFWNDTYLIWEMLTKPDEEGGKMFIYENVHVLFADNYDYTFPGQDDRYKAIQWDQEKVTDDFATESSISSTFTQLSNVINDNDFLFVWIMGHGGTDATGSYFYSYDAQKIYDTQLETWLINIHSQKTTVYLSFPSSGGFIQELGNEKTFIITSSQVDKPASRANNTPFTENETIGINTYHHGEFNFHTFSVTNGESPDYNDQYGSTPFINGDTDGDNVISISETFSWEQNNNNVIEGSELSNPPSYFNTSIEYPNVMSGTFSGGPPIRGNVGVTNPVLFVGNVTIEDAWVHFDYTTHYQNQNSLKARY